MPLGSASSLNIALPLSRSSFPLRQRHPPQPRLRPRGRSRPVPEPCSSRNARAARWPRLRRRRGRGRRAAPVCPAASAAAPGPGLRAPEGSLERFGLVLGMGARRGPAAAPPHPAGPCGPSAASPRSRRPRGRGPGAPTPPSRPAPAGRRRSGLSEAERVAGWEAPCLAGCGSTFPAHDWSPRAPFLPAPGRSRHLRVSAPASLPPTELAR